MEINEKKRAQTWSDQRLEIWHASIDGSSAPSRERETTHGDKKGTSAKIHDLTSNSDCVLKYSQTFYCTVEICLLIFYLFNQYYCSTDVSPALWSRLKYLNSYWMDQDDILYRYSWSTEDESHWLWWSSDFPSSATMRLTFVVLSEMSLLDIGWIYMKVCADLHVPLRMNPNDFGDFSCLPVKISICPVL